MPKFKVGDKVKIKSHKAGRCQEENCPDFNGEMAKQVKKVTIITAVISSGYYKLKIDEGKWSWGDCMLENEMITPVYWECVDNGSKKFWAAHIIKRGAKFVLARKWGRIGNNSQGMEQVFDDKDKAEKVLIQLVRAKESKGYEPIF